MCKGDLERDTTSFEISQELYGKILSLKEASTQARIYLYERFHSNQVDFASRGETPGIALELLMHSFTLKTFAKCPHLVSLTIADFGNL